MGTLCSCTLGIQPNVYAQLPAPQQAQVAEIFRAAEGAWTEDGPQNGFAADQHGGGGRPVFPIFLAEMPIKVIGSSNHLRGQLREEHFAFPLAETNV